jgi:hypothetical protein
MCVLVYSSDPMLLTIFVKPSFHADPGRAMQAGQPEFETYHPYNHFSILKCYNFKCNADGLVLAQRHLTDVRYQKILFYSPTGHCIYEIVQLQHMSSCAPCVIMTMSDTKSRQSGFVA